MPILGCIAAAIMGTTRLERRESSVSVTILATPLRRLVPQLADLTHKNLKVSKQIESDVMCICVRDVGVDDLVQKVAEAAGGEWRQEGLDTYLVPSRQGRAEISSKGLEARTLFLKKQIGKSAPPRGGAVAAGKLDSLYPLLSAIGAKALAQIPLGGRVVYSSQPTAAQFGLDKRAWEDVLRTAQFRDLLYPTVIEPKDVARQILVLSRSASRDGIDCRLELIDARGTVTADSNAFVAEAWFSGIIEDLESRHRKVDVGPGLRDKADEPIKVPTKDLTFIKMLKALSWWYDPKADRSAIAEGRKLLLNPEKYEPLSAPSDFLIGTAVDSKLQLVASLPDDAIEWMPSEAAAPSPREMATWVERDLAVISRKESGWWVISPSQFLTPPTDRRDLAELEQSVAGKLCFGLSDLLPLARHGFGQPGCSPVLQEWISLVNRCLMPLQMMGEPPGGPADATGWQMLRLFDALEPQQQKMLLGGNRIPLFGLSDEAKRLCESIIFGADAPPFRMKYLGGGPLNIEDEQHGTPTLGFVPPEVDLRQINTMVLGGPADDLRGEPTEISPDGLGDDARLSLDFTQQVGLFPVTSGLSPLYDQPGKSLNELAVSMSLDLSSAPSQTAEEFKKVKLVNIQEWYFRLYPRNGVFNAKRVRTQVLKSNDVYTLKTLPKELQAAFETVSQSPGNRILPSRAAPP